MSSARLSNHHDLLDGCILLRCMSFGRCFACITTCVACNRQGFAPKHMCNKPGAVSQNQAERMKWQTCTLKRGAASQLQFSIRWCIMNLGKPRRYDLPAIVVLGICYCLCCGVVCPGESDFNGEQMRSNGCKYAALSRRREPKERTA